MRTQAVIPAVAFLLAMLAPGPVRAANECQIQYGYHIGSGLNRQDKTATINLNAGATKTVNRSNMNFVLNKKPNQVRVTLSGALNNNLTLNKDQRNPGIAFYLTPTQLLKVQCLGQQSPPAFGSPEQLIQAQKQVGATVEQIAAGLKNTFSLAATQVASLLRSAGYSRAQVAAALSVVYGLHGPALDAVLAAAGYVISQTNTAVSQAMELRFVLLGDGFRTCNQYPGAGNLFGFSSLPPLPLEPNGRPQRITLIGNTALAAASRIGNLPGGASHTIRERGPCYLIVEITVPASATRGTTGSATVMSGSSLGPSFNWRIGREAPVTAPPPPVQDAARAPSGSAQIVLQTAQLYKVGTATTTDDTNNIYTALDPFNNSAHCQTVPEPTPAVARNNMPRASRLNINVPAVTWGVRNSGRGDLQNVTVELVKNGQVLAQQTIPTLAAGQQRTFAFQRPNSNTCVAKVGAGGGCYHCGTAQQGWNDNGVTVRVR